VAQPNFVNSLFSSTSKYTIHIFSIDIEENGKIPFLDVFVAKKANDILGHQVYRKSTHTQIDTYMPSTTTQHKNSLQSLVH